MGIRADRGAYWEEDEGKESVRGPRVTRAAVGYPERDSLRYILNGVSFNSDQEGGALHEDFLWPHND
jgi:hypothetical protein